MNLSNVELYIYYTRIPDEISGTEFDFYLKQFPEALRQKILQYKFLKDRLLSLFGKMLLCEGIKKYGFSKACLSDLQYNSYSRPCLSKGLDFNISHSGHYVVCAIGRSLRVGIDIEIIKPIRFADFDDTMTEEQWNLIIASDNPVNSFYSFWTIKESIIKADSRGMSLPLLDINIDLGSQTAICFGNKWYFKRLEIAESYSACLCSNKLCNCVLQYVDF